MAKKNAASVSGMGLEQLLKQIKKVTATSVLVGVPESKGSREEGGMNNATLAYIHDNGAPEANIPARPFMRPGIQDAREAIVSNMKKAAMTFTNKESPETYQQRAGIAAVNAIKARITSNIAPALKPASVAGRMRGRGAKNKRAGEKAYAKEIAAGATPAAAQEAAGVVALINTGQLRNSITYVLKKV